MSSVGDCGGRSVKCRGMWMLECQVQRSVEVIVSGVYAFGGRSVKCKGEWRSECQV